MATDAYRNDLAPGDNVLLRCRVDAVGARHVVLVVDGEPSARVACAGELCAKLVPAVACTKIDDHRAATAHREGHD